MTNFSKLYAKAAEEKYGPDWRDKFREWGKQSKGNPNPYFKRLKDEGREQELKDLQAKAAKKRLES